MERVHAAQTLCDLTCNDIRQRFRLERSRDLLQSGEYGLAGCLGCGKHGIDHGVGLLAQGVSIDDLDRQAPHVLDQNDAQRDRHRPQFADHQRLNLLVGADKSSEDRRGDQAVGVRHIGPGQPEDPRISCERTLGKLG